MPPPLSFLYQTKTILQTGCKRSTGELRRRTFSSSSVKCEPRHRSSPGKSRVLDRQTQSDISPGYDPNATLTPVEDQKFRAIFESAAKGLPPPSLQTPEQRQLLGEQQEEEEYVLGASLDNLFDNISKDAAANESLNKHGQLVVKGPRRAAFSPSKQVSNHTVPHQLPVEFPAALQGAWRDVRRAISVESQVSEKLLAQMDDQPVPTVSGNVIRLQEQNLTEIVRIRDLFEKAPTDGEVWAILEADVFSQITELVRTIKARTIKKPGKIAGLIKTKKLDKEVVKTDGLDTKAATTSQVTYPVNVLNAMRTFRKRFPRSPYALALIPKIKNLDPVSQVLGLSTELYNELLYISWRQHSDIFECARIVEDMHLQGLLSDRNTNAVYRDAEMEMQASRSSQSQLSVVRSAWWQLKGVKHAMSQWREAKTLMDARADAETRYNEAWQAEQRASYSDFLGTREGEIIAEAQ